MLNDDLNRADDALNSVYQLALGGTAVGTGINAAPGFGKAAPAQETRLAGAGPGPTALARRRPGRAHSA
jgi:fumarate hydratase, class II